MTDKLLILDIDETLLHTDKLDVDGIAYDFTMQFKDDTKTYHVKKRPFLNEFLKYAFENFQVGIFTTSKFIYVEELMKNLNVDLGKFKFIFDREYCNTKYNIDTIEREYVKRLDRVRRNLDFPIEKMLIVDDKPETARENYGNLLPIKAFYYDDNDAELLKLVSYLEKIKNAENFRRIEKRGWSSN